MNIVFNIGVRVTLYFIGAALVCAFTIFVYLKPSSQTVPILFNVDVDAFGQDTIFIAFLCACISLLELMIPVKTIRKNPFYAFAIGVGIALIALLSYTLLAQMLWPHVAYYKNLYKDFFPLVGHFGILFLPLAGLWGMLVIKIEKILCTIS